MNTIHDEKQPRPVYHTPTRSAAKTLEEMVENGNGDSSPVASSSSSSSNPSPRIDKGKRKASLHSDSPPLPQLPPSSPPPITNTTKKSRGTSKRTHTSTSGLLRLLESIKYQHQSQSPHQHHHQDASPTDSHPRARSHSRRRSSDAASSMLLVMTERLSQETTRANEAERQAAEVLSHFKSAHEAKLRMERDLQRVKDELELYKIQLDLAQKEIFRAQEVVDRVDRQRVEAEDEARRTREKNRTLMTQRAVEQAMEEGRRLGYEEGVTQGRMLLYRRDRQRSRDVEPAVYSRRAPSKSRVKDDVDQVSYYSYTKDDRSRSSGSTSSGSHTNTKASVRSSSRPHHAATPDVARYNAPLPVPTVATPTPMRVPSTQPQPQPQQPHPSSSLPRRVSIPESIAIQPQFSATTAPGDEPIRPVSVRNRSPSVSHRSIVLPPDGYIPMLGSDSMISLPPPHELSSHITTSAIAPPPVLSPVAPTPTAHSQQSQYASRSRDRGRGASASRVRDYAYSDPHRRNHVHTSQNADGGTATNPPTTARSNYTARTGRTRTVSTTSRGSTRLSELDLLSSPIPRDAAAQGSKGQEPNTSGVKGTSWNNETESVTLRRSRPRSSTQPERIVEQWRSANRDFVRSVSPTTESSTLLNEPEASSSRAGHERSLAHGIEVRTISNSPVVSLCSRVGRIFYTWFPEFSTAIVFHNSLLSIFYLRTIREASITDIPISSFQRPTTTDPVKHRVVSPTAPSGRAPRRPREIVLPTPLSSTLLSPNNGHNFDRAAQEAAFQRHNGNGAPQSHRTHDQRANVQRSASSMTVPGIEVVTPSSHTNSGLSERTTVVDPVLLTPESANRPVPLPSNQKNNDAPQDSGLGLFFNASSTSDDGGHRISMVLPDNNLPAGFVPLSPIPGMGNLNPYPPGFAPNTPKFQEDHTGGLRPNFTYPSSPITRSH
ncbi:hypothetical protein B0H34DRAFT_284908 [Crassisporium funariophilum]|nr:hypothetical protein B0H34DRAFT_284908 [Crassisporium funariophilum]